MIGKIVGGLFSTVVENAEGILDKVITTDKERDEAKLALKRLLLELYQSKHFLIVRSHMRLLLNLFPFYLLFILFLILF